MTPPDFKSAYLRLAAKVYRTGLYYRLVARSRRNHARFGGAEADTALGDSLDRCAKDMEFIFARAAHVLTEEDVARIKAENPTPFASENQKLAA